MTRRPTVLPCLDWPGRPDTWAAQPGSLPRITEIHGEAVAAAQNLVIRQDNLSALAALARDPAFRADLVYADPPFATGLTFKHKATVGDDRHEAAGFRDAFPNGLTGWLDSMAPRLQAVHDLLSDTGSLYLHLDSTTVHYARVLLDELFGSECFQREIVWRIGWLSGFKTSARNWIRNHDTLLYYVKSPGNETFNKAFLPHAEGYVRRDGKPPKGRGIPLDDVWNGHAGDTLDSIQIKSLSREKTGYPTQKNEALLHRIITASSNPGDRIADPFCGSGTTAVVAHQLGRSFVTIDSGAASIAVTRKRLLMAGAPFTVCQTFESPAPTEAPCPHLIHRAGAMITVHAGDAAPIDQCLVGRDTGDGVLRPSVQALRGREDPGLDALEFPFPAEGKALVQVVDVEGRTWRVVV